MTAKLNRSYFDIWILANSGRTRWRLGGARAPGGKECRMSWMRMQAAYELAQARRGRATVEQCAGLLPA